MKSHSQKPTFLEQPDIRRKMDRSISLLGLVGFLCKWLGSTKIWGQNQGLLGPNLGFSGGKGNRLNRTFGRGGGDRNDKYLNKVCVLNALQPPSPANRNKRNKFAGWPKF